MTSRETDASGAGDAGLSPLALGSEVAHYRIVSELGRGGMAVVYRAVDTRLDREVALKCPRPDGRFDADHLRRFLREARSTAKLSHPNIVPLLDVLEHSARPILVMELVDGGSLRQTLSRGGPLPLETILRYAEELAEALRAAHAKRILHRDVTPNNILVGSDGRARLTDFGLAHLYVPPGEGSQVSTDSTGQSSAGRVVGTPGYMSPEQLLGQTLGPGTDLFSLGAVIYEMCSGQPAFRSSEHGDVLNAILHREPASLSRMNYEVPEELERIVRKALAKRVDERYQSAAEMIADLKALRRQSDSQSVSLEQRVAPRRRRRRRALALAGATAAVAVFLGLWIAGRSQDHPLPEWTSRQLTSDPGWERDPALSPDGSLVAYASDRGGASEIWIVDARGGEPRRLTETGADARSPAWFPDGRALAYVSGRSGADAIWKVPWPGGSAVLLLPDAIDPAISPDGTRIAFARTGPSGARRIAVAEVADPSRAVLLTGDGDGILDHREPAWSPDGRTLCYADLRDLWLVPSAGGAARRVTDEQAIDEQPIWSRDGRYLYFSSKREGARALWRVAANGSGLSRLTLGTGPEVQPTLSAQGRRLAYSTFMNNNDISILDTSTGARARIAGQRDESLPALSPDGGTVVFSSDRDGTYDLWVQPLEDGRPEGPPRKLTEQAGSEAVPVYSPDGRWIAYGRVLEDQRDIWLVSSRGGPPRRITSGPEVSAHPSWSPDGSRLAFVVSGDGGFHVWVQQMDGPAPRGEPEQLTFGNSIDLLPVWSPDGSSIAYLRRSESGGEIWIVPVRDGSTPRRLTSRGAVSWVRWDPSRAALLASGNWDGETIGLRSVAPDTGRVTPFESPVVMGRVTGADEVTGSFDVSRDGRLLVYSESLPRGDIWILEVQRGSF